MLNKPIAALKRVRKNAFSGQKFADFKKGRTFAMCFS